LRNTALEDASLHQHRCENLKSDVKDFSREISYNFGEVEGGDILFLSVAANCIASGNVFGNIGRWGDNQDARCVVYGK